MNKLVVASNYWLQSQKLLSTKSDRKYSPKKIALFGEVILNIIIICGTQIMTHTGQICCTYNNTYDAHIITNMT